MRVFWLEAQPWDRAANAAVTVRACNVALSQAALIAGGVPFIDVLSEGPTISTQVFDGAFTGRTNSTFGSIPVASGQGDIDYWAALAWSDRPVKIWSQLINGVGDFAALSAGNLIWDGVAETFDPGLMTGTIALRVNRPSGKLASGTYAGSGGREGRAEIKGAVKPYARGQLLNRPAVLLDSGKGLYQVDGYLNGGTIDAVREGYRLLDQTRVAQATAAALVAATVPATEIHTFAAEGLFRIGFQPLAPITADFTTTGSARPGALIRAALLSTGWAAGKIDGSSLDSIDASLPYDGWLFDDQGVDIADVLDAFCRDLGGYWDVTELGVFYAGLVKRQSSVMTIGPRGQLRDQDYNDIDQLATQAPFWRNRVGYAFNPRTFSDAELGVIEAATTADWSSITGAGKPENNATRNVNRGTWAAGTAYDLGDFFLYASNSYSVTTAHTSSAGSPPPNGNVTLFVPGGGAGAAGLSSARVLIYKRAATSPALPTTTGTFTFATNTITGLDNGWTVAVPAADGNPLWVSGASASANTATDTIAAGEWASPVIQSQDGASGLPAVNAATIYLFKRTTTTTPPAVPSGSLTYTFASSALAGSLDGWTTSLPTSGGQYRWAITATALGTGTTDTIATGEWASPALLASDGAAGAPGDDGLTIAPSKPIINLQLTAGGTVKAGQLPTTLQMIVFDGPTNVTSSVTYSRTVSNCSVSNDGGGQFTVTALIALPAYFDVTATLGARSITIRIPIATPSDGSAASQASASLTSMNNTGTYVAIATADLVVAAGATVGGAGGTTYIAADTGAGTRSVRQQAKVTIANLTDGGADTNAGSEEIGTTAVTIHGDGPSDIGYVSASGQVVNTTGAPKTFRLKFWIRYYDGNTSVETGGGTYSGQFNVEAA